MFLYWFTQPLGLRPVPYNLLQEFPLIQFKVYNQITQDPILNPTRLSSTPLCSSPPHKMHNTVQMQYTTADLNTNAAIQKLNYKFLPIAMPNRQPNTVRNLTG